MDIGLGSLVTNTHDGDVVMVVAATAGDEMYCVSTDAPKSVKQWRHRSTLRNAAWPPVPPSFSATGIR